MEEEFENENVEFEDNIMLKMDRNLSGWGAKKEYPAIISVLIAIFIPIFGLFFVGNQIDYRKLKYGHASGFLLGLSAMLSFLWWGALIITLVIIF